MSDNTTSEGTGATPSTSPTATVNPATASATQQPATPTVEELLRRIAEIEHSHKNATEEVERHRKKLSSYEKQEKEAQAAKQAAEEAQLSEIERIKKQHAEAEQRIKQYQAQLATAHVKLAAQSKGIIDPDIAALAIQAELEYGDDGLPTNIEHALDKLLKHKPYLAPKQEEQQTQQQTTPATTAQPARSTPAIPAMNPGRSNIPAPGTVPPGKPVRLSDVWKRP